MRISRRGIRPLAISLLAAAALDARLAGAQAPLVVLAGGGLADRAGLVGHLGALLTPRRGLPVGVRADAILGSLRGQRAEAVGAAVEVAPRLAQSGTSEIPARGLYVFGAAGVAATRHGPSWNRGLMLAVGTRLGLGRVTLTAEQRFQQDFSPFLVGLAF